MKTFLILDCNTLKSTVVKYTTADIRGLASTEQAGRLEEGDLGQQTHLYELNLFISCLFPVRLEALGNLGCG